MILLLASIQVANAEQDLSARMNVALKANELAFSNLADCIENGAKSYLKKHHLEATPSSAVEAGIESCSAEKHALSNSARALIEITGEAEGAGAFAEEQTATAIEDLRSAYSKWLEEEFQKPGLADARAKLAVTTYSVCVKRKALSWSRLDEDARTVAEAAATACQTEKDNMKLSFGYLVKSQNLPESSVGRLLEKTTNAVKENALSWVVDERAKQLDSK